MINPQKLNAMKRVKQEYDFLTSHPIYNICCTVGLVNPSNIMEWKCTINGPANTPFENGLFYLKVKFPDNYPACPPEVSFITPIYHLNVNPKVPKGQTKECLGHVCISTLNWWKPTCTMKNVLTDIFALFYLSNPESPYGMERAEEFNINKNLYDAKCRYFTQKYASLNNNNEVVYTNDWDFTYNPN